MDITFILKSITDLGLQVALIAVFIWYFFKRDKDREESLTLEKVKLHEDIKAKQDEVRKELENAKINASEKEALLMSENAKREELIRKESERRETMIRAESMHREETLMRQMDKMNDSLKEISTSMIGINNAMEKLGKSVESVDVRLKEVEGKLN